MNDARTFVGVDWGTSNLRMTLVIDGEIGASWSSGKGIAKMHRAWREARLPTSREAFYTGVLSEGLDVLKAPAEIPLVISGMASSSLGLRELPYAGLPFSLDGSGAVSAWLESSVLLISGVAGEDDVMRGEETQIVGLNALGYGDGVYLLPGTHSKHVRVTGKAILSFATFLTGELFALLANHSTVGQMIRRSDSRNDEAFARGVEEGRRGRLLHRIFTVRALSVLGSERPDEGRERLSGMLIGSELEALTSIDSTIYLAASADLGRRYRRAGEIIGLRIECVKESDWRQAGLQGQMCLLERVWSLR